MQKVQLELGETREEFSDWGTQPSKSAAQAAQVQELSKTVQQRTQELNEMTQEKYD